MATFAFKKAWKYAAKARVALIGPSGSGKSYTALMLARVLVGPTGKVAAIDTEHESLRKYAHSPGCSPDCKDPSHFEFDVIDDLDSFTADNFLNALHAAEDAGYHAFITDSLSHFWTGKDGALEFVDSASARTFNKDSFSGWKAFRPHERKMIDAMLASPLHIITTMRTKNEYVEVEKNGKKQRVKVGLGPVQRDGIEYEFDLVGLMDDDNMLIVDKSRCFALGGKAIPKPGPKDFAPFVEWLAGEPAPAQQPQHVPHLVQPQEIFHVEGDVVTAKVLAVEARVAQSTNRSFRVVKLNGKVVDPNNTTNGKAAGVCWHESLFEALAHTKDRVCRFRYSFSTDGYLTIEDVVKIGDQEYSMGLPYDPETDAEPEPAPTPEAEMSASEKRARDAAAALGVSEKDLRYEVQQAGGDWDRVYTALNARADEEAQAMAQVDQMAAPVPPAPQRESKRRVAHAG
jgi:energy-coupling factor transporter ATP-binding protein EcfA2/NACalpha-BTF3-like transcription factor